MTDHVAVRLETPVGAVLTLMDVPTGTVTDVEIVHVVPLTGIVQVRPVADQVPFTNPTVIVKLVVALDEGIVKVKPVKVSAVFGVVMLAVDVPEPAPVPVTE